MVRLCLILLLVAYTSIGFTSDHIMKNPDMLEWKDGPKSLPPGAQMTVLEGDMAKKAPFTVRLKFPANYRIGPHWHPAIEHVTVIEGKFSMGAGDQFNDTKAQPLMVGGFAVMPVKFHHFAFTSDVPATVQLHGVGPWDIIYLDPKDDPRKQK